MANDKDAGGPSTSGPIGRSDPVPMLRREDFCEERIASFSAQAELLGSPVLSQEEREASLQSFIAELAPGEDAWVFAYGSLMWNPAFHIAESRAGTVNGYHRTFCFNMLLWRASPECPGLMLGLDGGGSCHGVAHRIAADEVESELRILWMREMLTGSYRPRWVRVRMRERAVRAITFIANRAHPRYVGKLPEETIVDRIARAAGTFGTNRHYLFELEKHLETLGILDGPMHRLAQRVRSASERSGTI